MSSPAIKRPASNSVSARFAERTNCPACGNAERTLVADLPFTTPPLSRYLEQFYGASVVAQLSDLETNRYRLARCSTCATHYQVDVPSPAWLARFYAAIQVPGDEAVPTFIFEQRARELAMVARRLDSQRLSKTALDFGVGTGGWARLALAAGFSVAAMDVATGAFPRLEAAGIRCSTPFATDERNFSLIHVEQVFEHLSNPHEILGQLCERLAPGGIILIGVPHDPDLEEKLRTPNWLAAKHESASLNAVAPLEHLNAFSPEGLRQLGARHDLRPLEPHGWELHAPGEKPTHLRARIGSGLRRRLREHYHPAWALTQTVFLQKPVAS